MLTRLTGLSSLNPGLCKCSLWLTFASPWAEIGPPLRGFGLRIERLSRVARYSLRSRCRPTRGGAPPGLKSSHPAKFTWRTIERVPHLRGVLSIHVAPVGLSYRHPFSSVRACAPSAITNVSRCVEQRGLTPQAPCFRPFGTTKLCEFKARERGELGCYLRSRIRLQYTVF